jgi:hypothetical protein
VALPLKLLEHMRCDQTRSGILEGGVLTPFHFSKLKIKDTKTQCATSVTGGLRDILGTKRDGTTTSGLERRQKCQVYQVLLGDFMKLTPLLPA